MFSFTQWLAQHWFEAVQTGGIFAGLIYTAVSLRKNQQAQRITNLFALTRYQRELYSGLFNRPELRRIFHDEVDLASHPVTEDERLFLTMVILHLNLALAAMRMNAIVPIEGLERDLAEMFSKPIPRAVWKEIRSVQNRDVKELLDRITSTAEL
jgi:predicted HAD superfamily phosphohydrolase